MLMVDDMSIKKLTPISTVSSRRKLTMKRRRTGISCISTMTNTTCPISILISFIILILSDPSTTIFHHVCVHAFIGTNTASAAVVTKNRLDVGWIQQNSNSGRRLGIIGNDNINSSMRRVSTLCFSNFGKGDDTIKELNKLNPVVSTN